MKRSERKKTDAIHQSVDKLDVFACVYVYLIVT